MPPLHLNHDGNLIYQAEDGMPSDVYYYDRDRDQLTECTEFIHALAKHHASFYKKKGIKQEVRKKAKKGLDVKQDRLLHVSDKETVNLIKRGRLRMHLLLNAESGREYSYKEMMLLIEYIRQRGGHIDAYAKEKVKGYPALLFIRADTRYALAQSQFTWGLDWWDEENQPNRIINSGMSQEEKIKLRSKQRKVEKRRDNEIGLIRDLLISKTREDMRNEVLDVLWSSPGARKNPPEFHFTGNELMEFGIIQRVFSDTEALRCEYSKNLMN